MDFELDGPAGIEIQALSEKVIPYSFAEIRHS
jgi:hypothetical protein